MSVAIIKTVLARLVDRQSHKYSMKFLQNILDYSCFTSLREGKNDSSSMPWWDDCIRYVKVQVLTDRTTSRENLREKVKSYASNYIAMQTETSFIQIDSFLDDIADVVEKDLEKVTFDQRPPASVVAQTARMSIPEDPEERFIRLG